ncbi:Zn-dependent protease [Thiohalobacter thiocyanaticus]|uniref:Zn-dependent protease n=1 Tax=Thiohalobacter thiocyanaticus TaxID=585455 RepID=A0A1Z4VTU8_9GAMM|nr:M48 family metallopeptidase [Thiohalobacter thiocyanaticus]BAZ94758.1 Zn-dependent protease [Thiohalobacter thiocyanaticus]
MNLYTAIFLVMLLATALTQWWLAARHMRYIRNHRGQVPAAFRDHIPLASHRKAADYTLAKTRLGLAEGAYGYLILLAWTLGGGLALLNGAWSQLEWSPLWTGVAVMLSLFMLSSLLDLPFSLYHTFGLEARFGFNRTDLPTFIGDMLKNGLLLLLLGTPLIAVVLWLMQASGSLWWLYVWIVWMGFTLLMLWAYPAFIAPLFNKFSPLEDNELRQRIESLLSRCGFTSNGIFVMDGSKRSGHGNAYFTGLGENKRIVFFDTLLKSLDPDEVEAVLAHELGHFKHKHVHKRLVSMALLSLAGLAALGWLIQQPAFFHGLGVNEPSLHMGLILFLLVSPLFGFFLSPLMNALSRKHEFEADAYAASQTRAGDLVQALVKLYRENASTLTPDPLYSSFYDSHPPAPVRVAQLNANTRQPA